MSKFIQILFLVVLNSQAQKSPTFQLNSKVSILTSQTNNLIQIRFANLDLREKEQSNVKEGTLVLKRIARNVIVKTRELYENDTIEIDNDEKYAIDTDYPIPSGEEDKDLLENALQFVNKPITLKEDENGIFVSSKVKIGTPNIFLKFLDDIPTLNKNTVLSAVSLNFDFRKISVIDTVLSENYGGMFITKYTKSENGFDVQGELVPIKNPKEEKEEDIPNVAKTIFSKFAYKGKLTNKESFITKIDLYVDLKKAYVMSKIKYNYVREEKFRLLVENTFN